MVRMRCPRWYVKVVECSFCKYVAKTEYKSTWMQLPDKSEEASKKCHNKLIHHERNHHTCYFCNWQPPKKKGWSSALYYHQVACKKNPHNEQAKRELKRNKEALRYLAVKAEFPEDILKLIDGELHPQAATGSM